MVRAMQKWVSCHMRRAYCLAPDCASANDTTKSCDPSSHKAAHVLRCSIITGIDMPRPEQKLVLLGSQLSARGGIGELHVRLRSETSALRL